MTKSSTRDVKETTGLNPGQERKQILLKKIGIISERHKNQVEKVSTGKIWVNLNQKPIMRVINYNRIEYKCMSHIAIKINIR